MNWSQVLFIIEELSKKLNQIQVDINSIKEKLGIEEEE